MNEAFHHLLIRRNVWIQELQNQLFIDDFIFHQQHGTEGALTNFLNVPVTTVDDIAGL